MWTRIASVRVTPCDPDRAYREYTLSLQWPRSAPEYIDDWAILAELKELAATTPLLWQYLDTDKGPWEWK
jgi:hypothetical protein